MLRDQNISPEKLAYDRPSPKLVCFLAKHYGLKNYERQTHNFIVFDDYFKNEFSNQEKRGGSYF